MFIDLVCYRDIGIHEQDAKENDYSMFAVISHSQARVMCACAQEAVIFTQDSSIDTKV